MCRSLTTRDDPTKHLTEPQNYVRNANAQTLASNVPVCVYLGLVLANFQGSMLQGPGNLVSFMMNRCPALPAADLKHGNSQTADFRLLISDKADFRLLISDC